MLRISFLLITFSLLSCDGFQEMDGENHDISSLTHMIQERESFMIKKDIDQVMSQFSDDVTWINSQGYYFVGKEEVRKFHEYLAGNDSLDYKYKAGEPLVRIVDSLNAIAYYSWEMLWYKKGNVQDTVNDEIGLMTLNANKINDQWKWIAVTNQHTPWFYEKIEPVVIE